MPPGRGFPRQHRLTSPAQYRRVFQLNSRVADRYWTVLYRSNDESVSRLGMAVAKKRAKRAVDRNRIKRLVRESFRHYPYIGDVDLVVLPRESCVSASSPDLSRSLEKLWSRISSSCAK